MEWKKYERKNKVETRIESEKENETKNEKTLFGGDKKNGVRIETERLLLRDLRKGDSSSIVENANNLKISQYMTLLPYPYTMADAEWFVNHCLENQDKKNRESFDFGITLQKVDNVIGVIGLNKINTLEGTATMGYWLGEKYWKQGIMGEASRAVLKFGFQELDLRRMDISAVIENTASNALIKSLGFVHEGVQRRKHVSKSTKNIHDLNIYGLLEEEWFSKEKKL
ncbi:MAG: GNAT family protein [Candidatus Diapherotrites archaeon]|nr:GNAT family protein [Candidatus Diapherotrites archaeon]